MEKGLQNFNWTKKVQKIDVERYLRRIGYDEPSLVSLDYLKKLHKHHLLTIPFENLDIHWQNEIILDIDRIYNKVVLDKRGGFCYELNGLFYTLLLNLGFDCHLISCRVFKDGEESDDLDHMAIIVTIEGNRYLTDVGFGELFLEPKPLTYNQLAVDYNKYFKFLKNTGGEYILMSSADASDFKKEYVFSDRVRQYIEFMPRCEWHQNSQESTFTQKKVCSIATAEGRLTLTDDKLIETIKGQRKETALLNADDFYSKLQEHFGISYQIRSWAAAIFLIAWQRRSNSWSEVKT